MYDHVYSFFLHPSPLQELGDGHTSPVVSIDEVGVDDDFLRRPTYAYTTRLLSHYQQPAEL